MENELPLFDMVKVNGIIYNIRPLELSSRAKKLLELKKVSVKDNTDSVPITFYNELTKQLKKGKCYEIIEVRFANYMTQKLLKTTEFTEISGIEEEKLCLLT